MQRPAILPRGDFFIGFLADILIRGLYETQRKPAFYVRETDGMQGVE